MPILETINTSIDIMKKIKEVNECLECSNFKVFS